MRLKKIILSNDFEIYNFCNDKYLKKFKIYYNYLNNPIYVSYLIYGLQIINNPSFKPKILEMIKKGKNKKYIHNVIKKTDIVIEYYEQNKLISKSEIGKFFDFYKKNAKSYDLKKENDLMELFYKLVNYPDLITILKECFYIFSDYRACIYYLTPNINFYKTKKENVVKVVDAFKNNQNMLCQLISKVYLGEANPWGYPLYSSAYSMYETLNILGLYFKEPLKLLDIKFKVMIMKEISDKKLLDKLMDKYERVKLLKTHLDSSEINNVSGFIIKLKKLGYDMWFVIPLVFGVIFEKYELKGVQESNVFGMENIINQKSNNSLGVMCYLLNYHEYISNTNIFKNFNI